MKLIIGDWEKTIGETVIKNMPEEYKDKDVITIEDLEILVESAHEGRPKKGFQAFKSKVDEEYNSWFATKNENKSEDKQDSKPSEEVLNTSHLFEKGRSKDTEPKTENEKEKARLNREKKLAERTASVANLDNQLQQANEQLKGAESFITNLNNLKTILTKRYDGVIGIYAPITSINTRLKANVKNLVKPEERQYHPGAENADKTKTGKDIEAKYAKGLYEVSLIESNPGTVSNFIISIPEGLEVEQLTSFTSVVAAKVIEDLARDVATLNYRPVAIDKQVFTQLLTALRVPAYFLTDKGKKDVTQPYYIADPRQGFSDSFWWALKAYNKENRVTKLACRGYIPLSTYTTTSLSNTDKVALTSLIFGKSLTEKNSYTNDTKFNQLTPDSAAKFTGTLDKLVYTKFTDSNTVPSYDSTKNNPQTVSMKLPLTKMTEATDEKPQRPAFVKARFTETTYQTDFVNKALLYKDVLATCRRPSQSSRHLDQFKQVAYQYTLVEMSKGGEVTISRIE